MQQKCFRNVWRLVLFFLAFTTGVQLIILQLFPRMDYTSMTLISQLSQIIPAAVCIIVLWRTFPKVRLSDSLCLHGFNPALLPFLILIPYCCQSFASIVSMPLTNIITEIFGEYDAGIDDFSTAYNITANIFMLVIAAPLIEEFVFRGVLFRMLERYGVLTAVLVSAFIFALVHMDITSFITIFCLGVVFALIKYFTGSLWTTIIMHAVNNLICILQIIYMDRIGDLAFYVITLATAAAFPFLFIGCMRLIRGRTDWWRGIAWKNGVHAEFSVCLIITVVVYGMLQFMYIA